MSIDDVLESLKPWRERNARQAWRPITSPGDDPAPVSKFSGLPWLAASEAWPRCQECQAEMPLFLQLDLATTPVQARGRFGEGLLQLFYCTSCDEGFEAFSRTSLVRLLDPAQGRALNGPHPQPVSPARRITGWTEITDYPHPPEHETLGIAYTYDFKAKPLTTSIACEDPPVVAEGLVADDLAERLSVAEPGDKLGGWPCWIQGVEYPACPVCQAEMQMVFQLDSNDNLDFMFGDVGTGHITQCPVHKSVVAFSWACS